MSHLMRLSPSRAASLLMQLQTGKNESPFIGVYLLQVVFRETSICVFVSDELQFIQNIDRVCAIKKLTVKFLL